MISKSRIVIFFISIVIIWGAIIFRAAVVQVLPNKKMAQIQKRQFNKTITLNSRRGAIYDRNHNELAVTVTSYSVFADPKIIKNKKRSAKKLAKILKIPYARVYKKIKSKKRRFTWLKRRANTDIKDLINKAQIHGVSIVEEPKRIYPNGQLLSQTLGFVGSEEQGLEGLELKFDKHLRGQKRKVRMNRDARGRPLLLNGHDFANEVDGNDYHLTIDSELQYKLEAELISVINQFQADSAVGVIMDAETSEILSLANVPTFNNNKPLKSKAVSRRNRAITDAFEPGSTLKTFLAAAAITSGKYKPSTKVFCENGKFKVGKRIIREADEFHKFGDLTLTEILAQSSNIGVAKIGLDLGSKKVNQVLRDFGFGQKTGISFPGESKGIFHKLPWRQHLLSSISFGHGITTTPLQMASAYTAIANGGVLKKPILIRSVTNPSTNKTKTFESEVVKRVLTKEEASTLKLMLLSATQKNGTGYSARIHGFPVAGKTGTAQKVSPTGGYLKGAYIASFAGFVPANKPKFVIYIAVDNPRLKYYGSQVAAPVFARVASYAVLKEGLSPVLLSEQDIVDKKIPTLKQKQQSALEKLKLTQYIKQDKVPVLEGLSLRQVYKRVSGQDVKVKVNGSGRVVQTWPKAGEKLGRKRVIKVKLQ